MIENKRSTDRDFHDPDDAPDLSAPEWQAKLDAVVVKRGRPVSEHPKVSTTIRLSREVIDHFKAGGPGWQARIDETLKLAIRSK